MKIGLVITMLFPYLTCFILGMIYAGETNVKEYEAVTGKNVITYFDGKAQVLEVYDPEATQSGTGEEMGVIDQAVSMIKGTGSTLFGLAGMMTLDFEYFNHNTFTQIIRYVLLIFSVTMMFNLTSEMVRLFKFWG